MRDFALPRPVDLVLAEFASLNNLADRRDLARVFNAVARALSDDGWFCFDVNTAAVAAHAVSADVLGRGQEIQARATREPRGRRPTRQARLRMARAVGTPVAPRARDALARVLDRRRDSASAQGGRVRSPAVLRWPGGATEDAFARSADRYACPSRPQTSGPSTRQIELWAWWACWAC